MKGFDPRWKDLPDYIIGITKEIWEDRKVHTLHDYYSDDIVVRSPASVVLGNKDVIAATLATLYEFPDRELFGQDVIWSGDPENGEGMLSSHRLYCKATHSYDGVYGPATGKKLEYYVIADCHAVNNQINDEWLIRDQGHIVKQLGISPQQHARNIVASEGGVDACVKPFTLDNDPVGPYRGHGNNHHLGQRFRDIIEGMMSGELSNIPKHYDRACELHYADGFFGHGWNPADHFWLGLRASLPRARFVVHHQIGREDPSMPPRAALRWSLSGKHEGYGTFGSPSGAEVCVLGASHVEFGPYGVRREWTLYDSTSVYKQIVLHQGL